MKYERRNGKVIGIHEGGSFVLCDLLCTCSEVATGNVAQTGNAIARAMNNEPVLLAACEGALAALTQPATYPADIEAARSFLRAALAKAQGGT